MSNEIDYLTVIGLFIIIILLGSFVVLGVSPIEIIGEMFNIFYN